MQKIKRFFVATLLGMTMTIGLFYLMISLITINKNEVSKSNELTTQVKVSSSPGFNPATQIISKNQNIRHQLPAESAIDIPITPKALLHEISAEQSGESHSKSFAAPSSHQSAAKAGSKSQALVKVPGLFNVIGPDPQYPEEALLARQEGWVETMIHLNSDGTVSQVEVINASPAGVFELPVVTAVREWTVQSAKISQADRKDSYFHRFEFKISR